MICLPPASAGFLLGLLFHLKDGGNMFFSELCIVEDGYEEFYFLGYKAMQPIERQLTFWRNMLDSIFTLEK
jgi:hypothetical protein